MVDPTSDLDEDVDETNAPACAVCGTKLVRKPGTKVVTWIEDDAVQHRHFCDESCRERWDDTERTGD